MPQPDVARAPDDVLVLSGVERGLPLPGEGNARSSDAQRIRLDVPGVGRFLIEAGHQVVAWPEAQVTAETLSQMLTGPVLALLLMQRGIVVLHGAVVAIDGRAVVILGQSGDGKSTTAAACAARGHAVLSDDLAPLEVSDTGVTVRPTSAVVRMSDPSLLPSSRPPGLPPSSWRAADKTTVPVAPRTSHAPVPVAAIVALADGDAVDLVTLHGSAAVLVLLDHAFCRTAFQQGQAQDALVRCAAIAQACRVATLVRPRRLVRLPDVVSTLERFVRAREDRPDSVMTDA